MPKIEFRDISLGLQKLRNLLLGRKHTLHGRFPPLIAPRTIPPPDIPRGPEYKYSKQYYFQRSPFDSVKPPVVAPVAEGPSVGQDPFQKVSPGGMKPDTVCFNVAPTPGPPWWWDGHCYYDCLPYEITPCPPAPTPCPTTIESCAPEPSPCQDYPPPCPRSPDSGPRH